jgi:hypothetical protein
LFLAGLSSTIIQGDLFERLTTFPDVPIRPPGLWTRETMRMAVQNTLVQISLKGAPSTAVVTTDIRRFMMDIGEVLLGRDAEGTVKARRRAKHTWPAIVGFSAGCALGAACEESFGL